MCYYSNVHFRGQRVNQNVVKTERNSQLLFFYLRQYSRICLERERTLEKSSFRVAISIRYLNPNPKEHDTLNATATPAHFGLLM